MCECQRCGEDISEYEVVSLTGGVHARLCPACRTAWETLKGDDGSDLSAQRAALDAEGNWLSDRAAAGQCEPLERYLDWYGRALALKRACYALGLEFVKPIGPK